MRHALLYLKQKLHNSSEIPQPLLVMHPDLPTCLPRHKADLSAAKAAALMGWPAVEPLATGLLEWLQDINWPVAQVLAPGLAQQAAGFGWTGLGIGEFPYLCRYRWE